jgi:tRNA 2-selenouridine synthase
MLPERVTTAVPMLAAPAVLAARDALVIDLRSPAEHAADHLPGARNVPLFDDQGRALIGLLYTRASHEAAFDAGRRLVAGRIVELVSEVARLAQWEVDTAGLVERVLAMTADGITTLEEALHAVPLDAPPARPVVLHCWRGGLRSRSVIALLRALGLERAVGLARGYKGYRAQVLAELDVWAPPPAYALRGLTGVGKTLVLRALELERPGWTLDLEGCAGHRSSLLGMVGLEPVSQKRFESRIAARLRAGFPGPLVIEGESRKVGDAVIPRAVWEPLRGGTNVLLTSPTARRVEVLVADYLAREANRAPLRAQLEALQARLTARVDLLELFDAGREEELVEVLLEHYYDPLYRHSEKGQRYALEVDSTDPVRAAREIADWISAR